MRAHRNAVFATVPAGFPVGLFAPQRARCVIGIQPRRQGLRRDFPGLGAREEGLRILTSPRREASLFYWPGIAEIPGHFSFRICAGDLRGTCAAWCRRRTVALATRQPSQPRTRAIPPLMRRLRIAVSAARSIRRRCWSLGMCVIGACLRPSRLIEDCGSIPRWA